METFPDFPQISMLIREDGVRLFPQAGGKYWTGLCPFHNEKTGSFRVDDTGRYAGRYRCWGCGEDGNAYDWLQKKRGMTVVESLEHIRHLLALPPTSSELWQPKAPQAAPSADVETDSIANPLSPAAAAAWRSQCQRLLASPDAITRIADWRGLDPDFIRWAAARHLIGLRPSSERFCYGREREAFPVTRPSLPSQLTQDDAPKLLGVHIRLGPGTPGNTTTHNSYRFDPPGIGSWPLVIGQPSTARVLFFIEGQWDVFALAQLLGWHERPDPPSTSAIVGFRGANSWRLWLAHQPLHKDCIAYLWPDNDTAGSTWIQETADVRPNFFQSLLWIDDTTPRISQAIVLRTPGGVKDMNDALKKGLITGPALRQQMTDLHRQHRQTSRNDDAPRKGTFLAFCRLMRSRTDVYGDAARYVVDDGSRPRGQASFKAWLTHWHSRKPSDAMTKSLLQLYHSYSTSTPLPAMSPSSATPANHDA